MFKFWKNPLWQCMRPHQWLKNIFIFSGLIFGHQQNNIEYFISAIQAFIAFTLVCSAGYIFNDLLDKESDIKHLQKKYRPIASGKLSNDKALFWLFFLLSFGLGLGFYLSLNAFWLLITYIILVVSYSTRLKHIPWIEMICVAIGFVLRIFLGTWGIGIQPSLWVISCGFLLALFLIFAKRCSEKTIFKQHAISSRAVLNYYHENILNKAVYLIAALCIGFYIAYALSHDLGLTVIFVVLGIWRYLFLLKLSKEKGIELDAANEFFCDNTLQLIVGLWLISAIWLLRIHS